MNFKMLYIDGAWTPSASGAYIDVENPANKERFAGVPAGNDADVDKAAKAAAAALPAWAATPLSERMEYMKKMLTYFKDDGRLTLLSCRIGSSRVLCRGQPRPIPIRAHPVVYRLGGWPSLGGNPVPVDGIPGARRRRRLHYAVELSLGADYPEGRPGDSRRQYGRAEAEPAYALSRLLSDGGLP